MRVRNLAILGILLAVTAVLCFSRPGMASLAPWHLDHLVALLGSMLLLSAILGHLAFTTPYRLLGCGLMGIAFPTYYYGALSCRDPWLLFIITLGVYAIITMRWWAVAAIVVVGVLVEESAPVILVPAALGQLYFAAGFPMRRVRVVVGAAAIALGVTLALRFVSPWERATVELPSLDILMANMTLWRAWLSVALTFGLPGLLALRALRGLQCRDTFMLRSYGGLLVGFLACLLVFGYSLTAVPLDGRMLWFAYPFIIPLALRTVAQVMENRRARARARMGTPVAQ